MINDIYGIEKWGKDFFQILNNGNLGLLNPLKIKSKPIDLTKIVKKLNQKLSPPYIIRVSNYLEFMINAINENFNNSIKTIGYKNKFKSIYPIKVNQQSQVIKNVVKYSKKFNSGLEVGKRLFYLDCKLFLQLQHDRYLHDIYLYMLGLLCYQQNSQQR